MNTPVVIEPGDSPQVLDVYSRLLQDRLVFMGTQVTDVTANRVVAQLLYLSAEDRERDITLVVNSPGGSVTAGLGIYDIMQLVPNDVRTVCVGIAASMGSTLLTAGTAGKRYCLPNARVMIHQPLAGMEGTASDLDRYAKELIKTKKRMNEIYVRHTGQTLKQIEDDTDRDTYLDAEEAKDYGLVDHVVESLADVVPS